MQQLEDDDELAYSASMDNTNEASSLDNSLPLSEGDGRPSWMRLLHNSATTWLQLLPKTLPTLRRTVENIKVTVLLLSAIVILNWHLTVICY
jgi:dynein heavy chain 1